MIPRGLISSIKAAFSAAKSCADSVISSCGFENCVNSIPSEDLVIDFLHPNGGLITTGEKPSDLPVQYPTTSEVVHLRDGRTNPNSTLSSHTFVFLASRPDSEIP
jgi:hypothetical protein